jgi:hypothetical protein
MAKSSTLFPWANMAFQGTMLAIEAQQVIAMRLTKMALGGPHVQREAELMVSEKLAAMAESGQLLMTAAFGGEHDLGAGKVVRLYRRKVRANRRRLGASSL